MSRTYKDYKSNKKWDKRNTEFNSGIKKFFKRASNKKIRKTPITSPCEDTQYEEQTIGFSILGIEFVLNIKIPHKHYVEIENKPVGLDIWTID
jgi:hypothetical protein